MASDLRQRIDSIEAKAALLVERFRLVRKDRDEARLRIAELEKELALRDQSIRELNQKLEYLSVASVLSPDHADVESTRSKLAELVREIDKCIDKLSL